jgi:hypothetical protein
VVDINSFFETVGRKWLNKTAAILQRNFNFYSVSEKTLLYYLQNAVYFTAYIKRKHSLNFR